LARGGLLWDGAEEALPALAVDLVVDVLVVERDRVLFAAAIMVSELLLNTRSR